MDALTFATPRLIRNLMAAASQKLPINVYEYDKVVFSSLLSDHSLAALPGGVDDMMPLK